MPARAGSKRLPNKNSMLLKDKPLIQWTIEAALASKLIDRVLVSTDCTELASLSEQLGAWVPFLRPETLATDTSTTVDVVKHCLSFVAEQGLKYDYLMLLQPTSPLRDTDDIDNAITTLYERKGDAIVSVCQCEHPPQWTMALDDTLKMDDFVSKMVKNNKRSQDLPSYYRLNGAIYLVDIQRFLQESSLFLSSNSFAFEMSQLHSIDIDTLIDFKLAEVLINK